MAGQADLNPEIVEAVAAVAAETFFMPERADEIDLYGKLGFWQLGDVEQTRWRKVASNVLRWLRAEKDRRSAQAPTSPTTIQAGPLFARGAAR